MYSLSSKIHGALYGAVVGLSTAQSVFSAEQTLAQDPPAQDAGILQNREFEQLISELGGNTQSGRNQASRDLSKIEKITPEQAQKLVNAAFSRDLEISGRAMRIISSRPTAEFGDALLSALGNKDAMNALSSEGAKAFLKAIKPVLMKQLADKRADKNESLLFRFYMGNFECYDPATIGVELTAKPNQESLEWAVTRVPNLTRFAADFKAKYDALAAIIPLKDGRPEEKPLQMPPEKGIEEMLGNYATMMLDEKQVSPLIGEHIDAITFYAKALRDSGLSSEESKATAARRAFRTGALMPRFISLLEAAKGNGGAVFQLLGVEETQVTQQLFRGLSSTDRQSYDTAVSRVACLGVATDALREPWSGVMSPANAGFRKTLNASYLAGNEVQTRRIVDYIKCTARFESEGASLAVKISAELKGEALKNSSEKYSHASHLKYLSLYSAGCKLALWDLDSNNFKNVEACAGVLERLDSLGTDRRAPTSLQIAELAGKFTAEAGDSELQTLKEFIIDIKRRENDLVHDRKEGTIDGAGLNAARNELVKEIEAYLSGRVSIAQK